jgi:hypothetical protein
MIGKIVAAVTVGIIALAPIGQQVLDIFWWIRRALMI